MGLKCVRCIKNRRTGPDLLCDSCREELKSWELCRRCNRRYPTVWQAPDDIFQQVTGITNGSGLLCISCFDVMAREKGVILFWNCERMSED